jgi:anti-anti-sigma factor
VTVSEDYQCLAVEKRGDVSIVRFRGGSFDEPWMERLGSEFLHLVEKEGCRKLVLSLGELDCLYSMLLGKLISLSRAMQANDGRMKLCCLPPHVREVFAICKLDNYFEFVPDIETAMKDW